MMVMASSKTELFDEQINALAGIFKSLAHPARLAILKQLADAKSCITTEFADELPLSRTTVNQHLYELKKSGLLKWHSQGAKTFYCLNHDRLVEIKTLSVLFLNEISTSEHLNC
jgi:ArsR family transcriptional regulator, arsenate/arsenite/antimonite-responsive transcriptional repressor